MNLQGFICKHFGKRALISQKCRKSRPISAICGILILYQHLCFKAGNTVLIDRAEAVSSVRFLSVYLNYVAKRRLVQIGKRHALYRGDVLKRHKIAEHIGVAGVVHVHIVIKIGINYPSLSEKLKLVVVRHAEPRRQTYIQCRLVLKAEVKGVSLTELS